MEKWRQEKHLILMKNSGIINNRNLKNYSCFTGSKQIPPDNLC